MNRKATRNLTQTTLRTCLFVQSAPMLAAAALFVLIGVMPSPGAGGLLLPTIQDLFVVQATNTSTTPTAS